MNDREHAWELVSAAERHRGMDDATVFADEAYDTNDVLARVAEAGGVVPPKPAARLPVRLTARLTRHAT